MADLTAAQIFEIDHMCEGSHRNTIGTRLGRLESRANALEANDAKLYDLGTPIAATTNYIVASADMKVGTYTIAHQPDVPRNITVTHTTVATGTDTLGTITVVGTNVSGAVISEVITPSADTTVAGELAFKTITSVTGAGWVIADGNDTIVVGVGAVLGLPVIIDAGSVVGIGFVGASPVVPTVAYDTGIEDCTVDLSSGTYDGSKHVLVFVA